LKKSAFELENAISIQDLAKVEFISHTIKGAAANFEISSIRQAAQEIESQTAGGNLKNAGDLLGLINSTILLLENDYQKKIQSSPK
jgi:HPt (histidine-containing phosphotransfer) domain-containing protein